jgi:putative addiction module component (TIGR02574 family)
MTSSARSVLRDALALPEDERADLAAELIASLDGPPDAGWEQAWSAEIDRRLDAATRAGNPGVEWADARREILAKLGVR